jgi:hypothetical protein
MDSVKRLAMVEDRMSPSGLTKVWTVRIASGQSLGEIRWYAPWRKYAFFPMNYTTWDNNCLNELVAFLDNENAKKKAS